MIHNKQKESLHETATDKIRKYRADYNHNSPTSVSFIPAIPSTSGRLHGEFIRLLFLQTHRETDHFFTSSGVRVKAHSQTSRLLTSSLSLGVPVPRATQCMRDV